MCTLLIHKYTPANAYILDKASAAVVIVVVVAVVIVLAFPSTDCGFYYAAAFFRSSCAMKNENERINFHCKTAAVYITVEKDSSSDLVVVRN